MYFSPIPTYVWLHPLPTLSPFSSAHWPLIATTAVSWSDLPWRPWRRPVSPSLFSLISCQISHSQPLVFASLLPHGPVPSVEMHTATCMSLTAHTTQAEQEDLSSSIKRFNYSSFLNSLEIDFLPRWIIKTHFLNYNNSAIKMCRKDLEVESLILHTVCIFLIVII